MGLRRAIRPLIFAAAAGWFAALSSGVSSLAWAGGGPQNVAVIVNPMDQDSLEVANAYIAIRNIPSSNVFYIPWPGPGPRAAGIQVRDKIIRPLIEEIERRDMVDQIDIVAFSTGYPYVIDCSAIFPGQSFAPQSRPFLSLTSAAYLFPMLLEGSVDLLALNSNNYYSAVNAGSCNTRSFAANLEWGPNGRPVTAGGRRYLLSSALGVSHGRGNSTAEIISNLQRSQSADATKPAGTIYYMRNNDIRSKARHDSFPAAVKELQRLNIKAEIVQGSVPLQKADVAGLTTGSPLLNLRSSGSTILPGALVDNLTSGAGQFVIPPTAANPQTPVSEFLRQGAAGASGAIVEPYAIPAKFPTAMLHVHYVRGCSMAESFYQSIAGPYHMIIVGDPLCQPWAIPPRVEVGGIAAEGPISGLVELTPSATYPDSRQASRFELFLNGKRRQTIAPGEKFKIHTNSLPDGFVEMLVVAIDDTPIAVQGSWSNLAHVKNGRDAIQLTLPGGTTAPINANVQVDVSSTVDADARVFHNGRQLGVIAGGRGTLQIPTNRLGKGPSTIHAVQGTPTPLRSRPVVITVR